MGLRSALMVIAMWRGCSWSDGSQVTSPRREEREDEGELSGKPEGPVSSSPSLATNHMASRRKAMRIQCEERIL